VASQLKITAKNITTMNKRKKTTLPDFVHNAEEARNIRVNKIVERIIEARFATGRGIPPTGKSESSYLIAFLQKQMGTRKGDEQYISDALYKKGYSTWFTGSGPDETLHFEK
jgi:hypothetical protein